MRLILTDIHEKLAVDVPATEVPLQHLYTPSQPSHPFAVGPRALSSTVASIPASTSVSSTSASSSASVGPGAASTAVAPPLGAPPTPGATLGGEEDGLARGDAAELKGGCSEASPHRGFLGLCAGVCVWVCVCACASCLARAYICAAWLAGVLGVLCTVHRRACGFGCVTSCVCVLLGRCPLGAVRIQVLAGGWSLHGSPHLVPEHCVRPVPGHSAVPGQVPAMPYRVYHLRAVL